MQISYCFFLCRRSSFCATYNLFYNKHIVENKKSSCATLVSTTNYVRLSLKVNLCCIRSVTRLVLYDLSYLEFANIKKNRSFGYYYYCTGIRRKMNRCWIFVSVVLVIQTSFAFDRVSFGNLGSFCKDDNPNGSNKPLLMKVLALL